MSDTGKQSPLGANVLGSVLQNTGLTINPTVSSYAGVSKNYTSYTFGSVVQDTCLRLLTYAINDAYTRGAPNSGSTVTNSTYDNLISIGSTSWYAVTNPVWSTFMNTYGVWKGGQTDLTTNTYSQTISFPVTGSYTFQVSADDNLSVYLDGSLVVASSDLPPNPNYPADKTVAISINSGSHLLYFTIENLYGPGSAAIKISKPDTTMLWNTRQIISVLTPNIPALGNSKPPTFTYAGPANQGDSKTSGNYQNLSWNPYDHTNAVTQWGFTRVIPLQAWNEFNWNGDHDGTTISYKDFTQSFSQSYSFIEYTNVGINALKSAPTFLKGTYSNMNDLISADLTGVSLSTNIFGQDLIATGKVINLQRIDAFGLPSVLLTTLQKYNAISPSISLALIATGLQPTELDNIMSGSSVPSVTQEQKIYGAFLIIQGVDLIDTLTVLNCKTLGLESLADLLNPIKLFPNSYATLTVPIYNAAPGPTNSKTYYPIYGNGGTNPALNSSAVIEQTAGSQLPLGPPPTTPRTVTTSTDTSGTTQTGAVSNLTSGIAASASTSLADQARLQMDALAQNQSNAELTAMQRSLGLGQPTASTTGDPYATTNSTSGVDDWIDLIHKNRVNK